MNAGIYEAQNAGVYQSQNSGVYQSQNSGVYQSQNSEVYQSQNLGVYQSQNLFPEPEVLNTMTATMDSVMLDTSRSRPRLYRRISK